MSRHRFAIDEYETCSVCGCGLADAWDDAVHWFGKNENRRENDDRD